MNYKLDAIGKGMQPEGDTTEAVNYRISFALSP